MGQSRTPKIRKDGWTAERQLRFLDALTATRSVVKAAAAAGISRESAYRLRARRNGGLFAVLWDRALKGHTPAARPAPRPPKNFSIPPKVTKLRKWKDPGFDALLRELRDL